MKWCQEGSGSGVHFGSGTRASSGVGAQSFWGAPRICHLASPYLCATATTTMLGLSQMNATYVA